MSTKEGCEMTIQVLEQALATKSKQLTEQVMLNGVVLMLGIVGGFIVGRWFKKSK